MNKQKKYIEKIAEDFTRSFRELDENGQVALINFLDKHDYITTEILDKWADINHYNREDVKEFVYMLSTIFVKFLIYGEAYKKGTTIDSVDKEQLKMGIEVEKEHTIDEDIATRIALDHLSEDPQYYTKLKSLNL